MYLYKLSYVLQWDTTGNTLFFKLVPSPIRPTEFLVVPVLTRFALVFRIYIRLQEIYKSKFGCPLSTVFQIWNMLDQNDLLFKNGNPKHLYWCLSYLKSYGTILNYCTDYWISDKTFRKWVTIFLWQY
jgi:hypothetical protein